MYDDIVHLNYQLLPIAFGYQGWLTAKVGTVADLKEVLEKNQEPRWGGVYPSLERETVSQPLPSGGGFGGEKLAIPRDNLDGRVRGVFSAKKPQ